MMMKGWWMGVAAALVLAPATGLARKGVPQGPITGQASIVDGDTLDIHGQRIRLFGVDALESSQLCMNPDGRTWHCGAAAANRVSEFVGRRPVTCQPRDTDRYGRTVAVCKVGGIDVGLWAVQNGWALAFRRYSKDYVAAEDYARRNRLGVHGTRFEAPWDYRKNKPRGRRR